MSHAKTAAYKIRHHFNGMRNENGMEAAQVILILVLVVVTLIPVIQRIVNALVLKGEEVERGIAKVHG